MNTKKYFYGLLAVVFALCFSAPMAVADNNAGDTVEAEQTFRKFCKGKSRGTAAINDDGTVASCWKCNKSPAQTRRISSTAHTYEVDWRFSDVRASNGYCRSVQADTLTTGTVDSYCTTADRAGDISSVWVDCKNRTDFFIYLKK